MDKSALQIRALLIEDDDVDARPVQRMLARLPEIPVHVTHTDSLSAGVAEATIASNFDVVLLDLGLPESRGLPTLDRFREACGNVADDLPIVVLTSADDRQLGLQALQHGAQDYLVKGKVDAELITRAMTYAIERQRMRRESERLLQELKRSNAELEQFAYVASHDLMAPLRTVISYCQLLEKRCGEQIGEDGRQFTSGIIKGTQRMQMLVQDLLALSRVQKQEEPNHLVELTSVFDEVITGLSAEIEITEAKVTCGDLPTVKANSTQMAQLLQNLVGNAIKFHGERSPVVHVGAERNGTEWTFSVRDNGIGIAEEDAAGVFEIFKRLHSQDAYPGTGIGLALCKKIVEVHGGRIWMESQPGEGTAFYFTLPD